MEILQYTHAVGTYAGHSWFVLIIRYGHSLFSEVGIRAPSR